MSTPHLIVPQKTRMIGLSGGETNSTMCYIVSAQ